EREQLVIDPLGGGEEARELLAGELLSRLHPDRHRVGRLAVDAHLVVEMWAGGASGGADIADDLALAHALSRMQSARHAAHMGVGGLEGAVVPEDDEIAV